MLALSLALAAGGCATTNEKTIETATSEQQLQEATKQADAALAAHRYRDAIARYQAVLRQDQGNAYARLGLAEAYLAIGANEQALQVFESLTSEPPEMGLAAREGQGIALLRLGQIERAFAVLQQLAQEDPTRWRAWNALGHYYDRQQQWEQAQDSYGRALQVRPASATIHNNLGFSLLGRGEYEAAMAEFAHALRLRPDLEIARRNLRLALAFQGRYAEALAGVEQAHLPEALNNIGYVALIRGEYQEAEAYFLRALEHSPSFYLPAWKNLQYLASLR